MKTNNKKGISLIVLVITIVVIIILAVAVILTLANNNPIENARKAAFQNDLSTIKDEISLYIAEKYAEKLGEYNPESFSTADLNTLSSVKNSSFKDKVAILNGKLVLVKDAFSAKEVAWASEIGIVEGDKQNLSWDGVSIDTAWYDNNSSATTFEISTAEELAGLEKIVNDGTSDFAGKTINLMNDIDLSSKEWRPIGNVDNRFSGTFNGNYHSISSMKIVLSDYYYKGLFGTIDATPQETMVENIILKNSTITGEWASGIVGDAEGYPGHYYATIRNCASINNNITGSIAASGIVGYSYYTKIENSYNTSNVICTSNKGTSYEYGAGGITAPSIDGTNIYNCYNIGNITSVNTKAGGIAAGDSSHYLYNCYNIGSINGKYSGEIAGYISLTPGNIDNCYYISGKTPIGADVSTDGEEKGNCETHEISLSDLKLASAITLLNQNGYNEYVQDTKGINNGYPILKWQAENM